MGDSELPGACAPLRLLRGGAMQAALPALEPNPTLMALEEKYRERLLRRMSASLNPDTAYETWRRSVSRDTSLTHTPHRTSRHSMGRASLSPLSFGDSSAYEASRPPRRRSGNNWWSQQVEQVETTTRRRRRRQRKSGGAASGSRSPTSPRRFRLARATESPPPSKPLGPTQEDLLDRDRQHLYAALNRTSVIAAQASNSLTELDSRHERLVKMQEGLPKGFASALRREPETETEPSGEPEAGSV